MDDADVFLNALLPMRILEVLRRFNLAERPSRLAVKLYTMMTSTEHQIALERVRAPVPIV